MRRTIDTLHDGLNRAIRYRAPRYLASELVDSIQPTLYIDGTPYLLKNLSAGGLAFQLSDNDTGFDRGEYIPITLHSGGEIAYSGKGRVLRIENSPHGQRIALRLTSGPIDLDQLMARHSELKLRRALLESPANDAERVHPDYRVACADAVHLLRRYRRLMDEFESHFQDQGGDSLKVFAQCERSFKQEWNNVCATANAAARQCLTDTESVMATKRFTEAVVTPELTEAPLWRHAYEKRHGYAPDAQLLTMLFSGARLGQSAYSRMMHQIALEHPVMTALVARMRSLKRLIAKVVTQQQDEGEVRITSLGCGPAKEMVSFLMEHEVQSPLKLTLIDRSEEALAAAHLEIGRLRSLWGEKLHIDCLYLPVDAMIHDTEAISALAPQHLIYSSGLLDSIGNVPAKALISRLYGRLNVNGHMALGAMVAPGRNMWSMEFVLDWSLAYRTAPAMSELTADLPNAEVTLANDENDVAWMLHVKRRQ